MFNLAPRLIPNVLKNQDKPSRSALLSSRNVKSFIVHVVLLIPAAAFFSFWINSTPTRCRLDPLLAYYSPVNDAVRYTEKQFDGRLNSTSIYRGSLGPEMEAAWERLRPDIKTVRLTHEQFMMAYGIDSPSAAQYRPEDGGGYMGQLDSYHHLHCLSMLRKAIRPVYYAVDTELNNVPRPHLGHCVDMIRQKLMCTVDLTMVTYDWVSGIGDPRPNLSTTHQCMDYERILEWTDQNDAHVPPERITRSGDWTEFPGEPL